MEDRPLIPLLPVLIVPGSAEWSLIEGWPYADPFVSRLLRSDLSRRIRHGNCRVWLYSDPAGVPVGFGSLDLSEEYRERTDDRTHAYIPLLAVNPTIKSLGYGTSIVRHLIGEATLLVAGRPACHDALFLDVYATSDRAIRLYESCGFVSLTPVPLADPEEAGKEYLVMARRVVPSA